MVRRGLLAKGVDESDRRSAVLSLTDAGRRTLAEADARLDELAGRILSELTADDRERLAASVAVVSDRVSELLRLAG
jgi:DNA-binding MarR family transcriptional regulator